MTPFLIIAAPRSRTYWTSRLLGCEHDPSRYWPSMEWGRFFVEGRSGVDTAVMMQFDAVAEQLKREGVRVATLRRAPIEIAESLAKLGIDWRLSETAAARGCDILDDLERRYGLTRFSSEIVTDYGEAELLHHWALGAQLGREKWDQLSKTHLETPHLQRDLQSVAA